MFWAMLFVCCRFWLLNNVFELLKISSISVTSLVHTTYYSFSIYKGNSSIPLFEIYKLIEKKTKFGLQTKTEGNASNIRGKLRHNRNTTLNVTQTETNYNINIWPFSWLVTGHLKKKMVGWTWFCGMTNLQL